MLGVGEIGAHRHATRGGVDHTAHGGHASRMVVDGSVGQLELHGRIVLNGCVQTTGGLGHVEQFLLGHGEVDLHGADVRHGGQWLLTAGAHEGTHTVRQVADHTAGRTGHVAVAKVFLGRHVAGLGLCEGCCSGGHVVLGRLELVRTDHVVLEELLVVVIGQAGGVELSLG